MEFDHEIAQEVAMACLNKGLLINKLKPNAIRLMPPLIITEKEVDEAISILKDVIASQSEAISEKGAKWTK
jgi:4-aminobutyrate aminotransferase-like enzyme